jgi:hypothetical protein
MSKRYKDLEDLITDAIFEILLDAKESGHNLLTFEEVCVMLGVDDVSLLSLDEKEIQFKLNEDFLEKLKDPEIRRAMLQSLKATKH